MTENEMSLPEAVEAEPHVLDLQGLAHEDGRSSTCLASLASQVVRF